MISKMCPDHPENVAGLSKILQNHLLCAFVADLKIDALSGKFLRQKSCYPESFRFLWLWEGASLTFINFFLTINLWCNRHSDFKTLHVPPSNSALVDKRGLAGVWDKEEDAESLPEKDPCCQTNICTNIACGVQNGFSAFLVLFLSVQKKN